MIAKKAGGNLTLEGEMIETQDLVRQLTTIKVRDAADEIERLREQLAECKRDMQDLNIRLGLEIGMKNEQLDECQKDAERYRWLRSQPTEVTFEQRIDVVLWTCEQKDEGDYDSVNQGLRYDALDAAIDEATELSRTTK